MVENQSSVKYTLDVTSPDGKFSSTAIQESEIASSLRDLAAFSHERRGFHFVLAECWGHHPNRTKVRQWRLEID